MAEKKAKDPFAGVKDEALREQKAGLEAEIAEKQSELNAVIQELGRRATSGKQATLAECNAKAREADAHNRKVQEAATKAAEAAAKKAVADAAKPKGKAAA